MCAPLDLSKYSANAYLMLLLVCTRYILWQSGNLAMCDKHSRLSSSHGSSGTHLVSVFFLSFAASLCTLLFLHTAHSVTSGFMVLGTIWEPVRAKLNCAYQSSS